MHEFLADTESKVNFVQSLKDMWISLRDHKIYDFYSDKDFKHCTGIMNPVIDYDKEMRKKRGKNFNTWIIMQFLL
jgi:hypothetical protein